MLIIVAFGSAGISVESCFGLITFLPLGAVYGFWTAKVRIWSLYLSVNISVLFYFALFKASWQNYLEQTLVRHLCTSSHNVRGAGMSRMGTALHMNDGSVCHLALLEPYWLTGRKTPSHLPTYLLSTIALRCVLYIVVLFFSLKYTYLWMRIRSSPLIMFVDSVKEHYQSARISIRGKCYRLD